MEMGSWAIMNSISPLWGLVPLFVFIATSFIKNINPLIPVAAGVAVGWIMTGNTPATFGGQICASLGSTMGIVGLLVLFASGLGEVLNRTHISTTICLIVAKRLKVNSTNKAILAMMASMFILNVCLGSFGSAAAIVTPIMLPLMAAYEVTPVAATTAVIFAAMSAYAVAPIFVGTFTVLELTGLGYGQYLTGSALYFAAALFLSGYFTSVWIQKKTKREGNEVYDESEAKDMADAEITPEILRRTAIFGILFVGCIVYSIVTGQGIGFIMFVVPVLALIMAVLSHMSLNDAIEAFYDGCKSMFYVFVLCLFYQMLINVISITGAFGAVGDLIIRLMGSNLNETSAIIIGTLVGSFGVDGGTAAQLMIINELFGTVVASIGMSPKLWSMVLLAGSTLTTFIYPNLGIIAPMGMCKTRDFKNVMISMWVTCLIMFIAVVLYALIAPGII